MGICIPLILLSLLGSLLFFLLISSSSVTTQAPVLTPAPTPMPTPAPTFAPITLAPTMPPTTTQPKPTTSKCPIDCNAGYKDLGPFQWDCNAGYHNCYHCLKLSWSPAKMQYCCKTENKGCKCNTLSFSYSLFHMVLAHLPA